MFCSAVIGALHDGQEERGTTRLKRFSGAGLASGELGIAAAAPGLVLAVPAAASSAHCSRHWRSSMIGTRWMTTFKKLPTSRPSARQAPMKSTGEEDRRSSTDIVALPPMKTPRG